MTVVLGYLVTVRVRVNVRRRVKVNKGYLGFQLGLPIGKVIANIYWQYILNNGDI